MLVAIRVKTAFSTGNNTSNLYVKSSCTQHFSTEAKKVVEQMHTVGQDRDVEITSRPFRIIVESDNIAERYYI